MYSGTAATHDSGQSCSLRLDLFYSTGLDEAWGHCEVYVYDNTNNNDNNE